MPLLIGWIVFALLVGWLASSKGRSVIGFFLLALFLSPLIGLIAVAIVPNRRAS